MGILQTNYFTCDVSLCGFTTSRSEESGPYSDPVIVPPKGWDYLDDGNTWACPGCVSKEKNAVNT